MVPANAGAETPPDKTTASYRFTNYSEADITTPNGTSPRYDIDVHQFLISGPATDNTEYSVGISRESMTGASPWWIEPGENDEPVQIMSGATIEEQRVDASANVGMYTKKSEIWCWHCHLQ